METDDSIEVNYKLRYGERLWATWEITLGSALQIAWLSVFPAMGVFLGWVMSQPGSRNTPWEYCVLAWCFAFWPVMIAFNTFRAHRKDSAKRPYSYTFSPEGLRLVTETSDLNQKWLAILRVRSTRRMLYLYFTKNCAHCIPRRVLSASGVERVSALASAGGVPRVGT